MKRYDLVNSPFNTLFDNFFANASLPTEFHTAPISNWTQFRVKERENGFLVEGELAGVKKEDIRIEIVGDSLKVSGSRGSKEAKDGILEFAEFAKSFTIGKGLDTDNIDAKFENGYLTLFIPKAEDKKVRLIDVK